MWTFIKALMPGPEATEDRRRAEIVSTLVGLSAKVAKADGTVSRAEIRALRDAVRIPPDQEAATARIYNLCARTIRGYEGYADRIRRLSAPLGDAVDLRLRAYDTLCAVAAADGDVTPEVCDILVEIGSRMSLTDAQSHAIRVRHTTSDPTPFDILGLAPGAGKGEIRTAWRRLAREVHPDRLAARGACMRDATKRMAEINAAYESLTA